MLRFRTGKRRQELAAGPDDLIRVIVFLVIGNGDPLLLVLADGVFDLEREPPERVGFEIDGDRVLSDLERSTFPEHGHDLGERKLERMIRRHLGRGGDALAPEVEDNVTQGEDLIVDPDLVDLGQHRIAETILEAETDAASFVLETPEGVELLQYERRDLHRVPPLSGADDPADCNTGGAEEPRRRAASRLPASKLLCELVQWALDFRTEPLTRHLLDIA